MEKEIKKKSWDESMFWLFLGFLLGLVIAICGMAVYLYM